MSVCMKERKRGREVRERWRQRRSTCSTLRVSGSPLHPDTFRLSLPLSPFHRSSLSLLLGRLPPFSTFYTSTRIATLLGQSHDIRSDEAPNLAAINRDHRSPIEVSRRDAEGILVPARDEKRHGNNRCASTAVPPRGEHLRGTQKGKTG